MFRKDKPMPMKNSASAVSNNLSVYVDVKRSILNYAVVSKHSVNLISASLDGHSVNQRQIVCKEPNSMYPSVVIQAGFVPMATRLILVLCAENGIQMFDAESSLMLYWYALGHHLDKPIESFSRGICGHQEDKICCGTVEGKILVFDVPEQGTNFTLADTLKGHASPIWDLFSSDDRVISSDDLGTILIWSASSEKLKKIIILNGFGYPCTSVVAWKDHVIGGYGSGIIRVYNALTGDLLAEIAAHAKWITSIDVAPSSGRILSSGEDCFVRIWQMTTKSIPIEHVHNECVKDQLIHGAKFINPAGRAFCCTGYDSNEIFFYTAS